MESAGRRAFQTDETAYIRESACSAGLRVRELQRSGQYLDIKKCGFYSKCSGSHCNEAEETKLNYAKREENGGVEEGESCKPGF